MVKFWTATLLVVLMGVQTFSIIAHALPAHFEDQQTSEASFPHQHDGSDHAEYAGETEQTNQGDTQPPDQCHTCNCHGSHLLLAMQPFELLPYLMSELTPRYNIQRDSGYIAAILRPPIA